MELSSRFILDADQARVAWEHIQQAKDNNILTENEKKTYRSLIRSASADILTSGLGQIMAFYASKGVENGQAQKTKAHGLLLTHITDFLRQRELIGNTSNTSNNFEDFFTSFTQDLPFNLYRLIIKETLGYISWLKRFGEAILPKPE
ncbi:MAG: type III-B CRISPR module-associated protein Cmr5 [Deltaproteobacteria bacterium]|nr:type III-B CRISPR module-associated protein Cmr5 [Deltaproteobacteria bacterium]